MPVFVSVLAAALQRARVVRILYGELGPQGGEPSPDFEEVDSSWHLASWLGQASTSGLMVS